MMPNVNGKYAIGLCETQPATAEGIRALLASTQDLECVWIVPTPVVAVQLARQQQLSVLLLDKGLGQQAVLNVISDLKMHSPGTGVVVWGTSMNEAEALRLLQVGARGLLRKSSDLSTIETCLRTVAGGSTWLEDCVFREGSRQETAARSELTAREAQVLALVEQGMRNKEIAGVLGIRPGTVKIHLKHIFEKTGVHGRYGLALNGMRQRGVLLAHSAEVPIELPHTA
jgi:DNA-binding NarL/FixJ family response regulator